MTTEKQPYDLEPESPAGEAPAAPPATPKAVSGPKPKIAAPGVLEGFPPDADFSTDPELDRAIAGKPTQTAPAAHPAPADARPDLVRPLSASDLEWRVTGAAGGLLLISALIATAITARSATVASTLLTLYGALLHAGTGIVAVYLAALFLEQRARRPELMAARMLAAVAAFAFLFNLNINVLGSGYETWKFEETVLAGAAYVGIVAGTFRLWGQKLLVVIGSHLGLWLIVQVGMALSAYVAAATTAADAAKAAAG